MQHYPLLLLSLVKKDLWPIIRMSYNRFIRMSYNRFWKRLFDLVIAILLLVILAPPYAAFSTVAVNGCHANLFGFSWWYFF